MLLAGVEPTSATSARPEPSAERKSGIRVGAARSFLTMSESTPHPSNGQDETTNGRMEDGITGANSRP